MGWQDRLRKAAVTTPDGIRFEFLYEDIERGRSENTSIFKFAEKSGAFIQRLSSGQDIYPLSMIFSGPDYDLTGELFWEKSKTPGVFLLEHPRFKGLKRVQLLTIKQRVAGKTADNQTIIDVVFHETLDIVQPETTEDTTTQILNLALDLSAEGAKSFNDNTELDNSLVVGDLQNESTKFIKDVEDKFKDIASQNSTTNTAFEAQTLSALSIIDDIVDKTLEFGNNLAILVATPSRVDTIIDIRINRYSELFNNTINRLQFGSDALLDTSKNSASLLVATCLAIVSGMSQAAVSNAEYQTRSDVIKIADDIVDINDITISAIDTYSDEFNQEENPADRRFEVTEALNILNNLVALTTAKLFDIAFTLKQERFITMASERDTVTVTHELYGYSDANHDFLIETNNLRGDELYLLPPGKEIVYYI